ncbi:hypothetical protein [Bradyrhizobium sp. Tv2a-2]|uniref:hypothetical protein n=1 Tax=Bradyrhizobium sp. Tv2a-2 TaxID=113395 RepID=UPI0004662531|nr:hypothetical protein [Bradyrhizobium sp. Tv2a-2]
MSSKLEEVARAIAIAEHNWWHGKEEPKERLSLTLASVAIDVADKWEADERRRTCKHWNRVGTGSIGSDGSGWSTWYCQECGASYDSRSTAQAGEGRSSREEG